MNYDFVRLLPLNYAANGRESSSFFNGSPFGAATMTTALNKWNSLDKNTSIFDYPVVDSDNIRNQENNRLASTNSDLYLSACNTMYEASAAQGGIKYNANGKDLSESAYNFATSYINTMDDDPLFSKPDNKLTSDEVDDKTRYAEDIDDNYSSYAVKYDDTDDKSEFGFNFFDKSGDGKLDTNEIANCLLQADGINDNGKRDGIVTPEEAQALDYQISQNYTEEPGLIDSAINFFLK